MKHIGAVLGSPKNYYTEKFAWLPKRLKGGSFVWLTKYIERETSWRWYKGAPIVSKFNISTQDAIIEKLKETK
jgi:hypothetical protein